MRHWSCHSSRGGACAHTRTSQPLRAPPQWYRRFRCLFLLLQLVVQAVAVPQLLQGSLTPFCWQPWQNLEQATSEIVVRQPSLLVDRHLVVVLL